MHPLPGTALRERESVLHARRVACQRQLCCGWAGRSFARDCSAVGASPSSASPGARGLLPHSHLRDSHQGPCDTALGHGALTSPSPRGDSLNLPDGALRAVCGSQPRRTGAQGAWRGPGRAESGRRATGRVCFPALLCALWRCTWVFLVLKTCKAGMLELQALQSCTFVLLRESTAFL